MGHGHEFGYYKHMDGYSGKLMDEWMDGWDELGTYLGVEDGDYG